jgi:hypothetical protein
MKGREIMKTARGQRRWQGRGGYVVDVQSPGVSDAINKFTVEFKNPPRRLVSPSETVQPAECLLASGQNNIRGLCCAFAAPTRYCSALPSDATGTGPTDIWISKIVVACAKKCRVLHHGEILYAQAASG